MRQPGNAGHAPPPLAAWLSCHCLLTSYATQWFVNREARQRRRSGEVLQITLISFCCILLMLRWSLM